MSSFARIASSSPISLSRFVLTSQLIRDWQAANPLPGRGEDRVAQRRSEWWHPRFPNPTGRRIALDDVHMSLPGGHVHPRHLEVVEVVLLRPTLAERDLPVESRAQGHDGCALHLGMDPVRICGEAAVHRHVDARHRYRAVLANRGFDHDRHVAHEAAMDGDAEAVARGKASPPLRLLGDQLHRAA